MTGKSARSLGLALLAFGALALGGCNEAAPQSVLIDLAVAGQADPQAIADAQAAIRSAAAEAGIDLGRVQTYRLLPQMAVEVDGEGALFLLGLSEVTALRPDRTKTIRN